MPLSPLGRLGALVLWLGLWAACGNTLSPSEPGGPGPAPGEAPADPAPAYRGRIGRDGRAFVARGDGFAFTWRGVSELLLAGAPTEDYVARRVALRRRQGFSVLRVLDPGGDSEAAMRRLLTLARERGVYVEWVLLQEPTARALSPAQRLARVEAAAELARGFENSFVELADEGWRWGLAPEELTQLGQRFKERAPEVLLSAGAAADGGGAFGRAPFDYVTVHSDRQDGEGGWRWVQRLAEGDRVGMAAGVPVVQDRPMGSAAQALAGEWDSAPERFRAAALLCHATRQYFTFHHQCALVPAAAADCQDVPTPGVEEIRRSDLLPADPRDGVLIDGTPAGGPWLAGAALGSAVLRLYTRVLGDGTGFYSYPLRVREAAQLPLRAGTTLTVLDAASGAVRSSRAYQDGEALALAAGEDVVIVGGRLPPPPEPPEPVPAQQPAPDVPVRGYTAAQAEVIVQRLYQALLGRAADPVGLGAYPPLVAGGRLLRVTSALVTSAEFEGRRPGLSVPGLSADLYMALLGRAPDAGGDAGTREAIRRGQAAQRAAEMVLSPEYEANRL